MMAACCGLHRPGNAAISRSACAGTLVSPRRAHTLSATSSIVGMSSTGTLSRFSASRYAAARGPIGAAVLLEGSATVVFAGTACAGEAGAMAGR
jgi:predicted ABC-type sugar transport system permease subunit